MTRILPAILLIASAAAPLPVCATNPASAQPCSERYVEAFRLQLHDRDIGDRGNLPGLIYRNASGKEHIHVVRGDGAHPVVLEVSFPPGAYSRTYKAQFRAAAGMRGDDAGCLRYAVRFDPGFAFVKGGKLPGLYGGAGPSGGKPVTGRNGFSTRFMWRHGGAGEAYAYYANKREPKYGESIGRGAWYFQPGRWTVLEQEVVLNRPGHADGRLRVWVNGREVVDKGGMMYRTVPDVGVDGLFFSTFFGGSNASWASPREQRIRFADFRLYRPPPR